MLIKKLSRTETIVLAKVKYYKPLLQALTQPVVMKVCMLIELVISSWAMETLGQRVSLTLQ